MLSCIIIGHINNLPIRSKDCYKNILFSFLWRTFKWKLHAKIQILTDFMTQSENWQNHVHRGLFSFSSGFFFLTFLPDSPDFKYFLMFFSHFSLIFFLPIMTFLKIEDLTYHRQDAYLHSRRYFFLLADSNCQAII